MNNILNKAKQNKNSSGYTLIEMVIYVALIGIVSVFIYSIILFIYTSNTEIVNLSKINSNAYSVMERMRYEVENSDYIYLPTSNMANYNYDDDMSKTDQLSLATKIGALSPDDITFVDIYLENEAVFIKKENTETGTVNPIALTSSGVAVSDLSFFYYKNDSRESITIDITIESKNNSASNPSINLINTIALRSF